MGRGHVEGVLAGYAEGFREQLLERGYTEGSAARLIHLTAHLSRWMAVECVEAAELHPDVVARFVECRRAEGYVGWLSARALEPLLGYLVALGVLCQPGPAITSALDELVGDYRRYLVHERGLAVDSQRQYLGVARRFLESLGDEPMSVLTAAAVVEFVRRECSGSSTASAAVITKSLRALLRYLYLTNKTPILLSAAVPSPAAWRLAGLPRPITNAQVEGLLASCDRTTAAGRRDFAVLKVLVRLGLRAGEVARLELADLDWHVGEVLVRGKGRRHERLPLPLDVGEAIVAWLEHRPATRHSRAVFVRLRAPEGALSPGTVSSIVRHACERAGQPPIGAHRLRHTVASELLTKGASLNEVGRVLRQHRLATTAIYAKIDLARLAALVRPWPGTRP